LVKPSSLAPRKFMRDIETLARSFLDWLPKHGKCEKKVLQEAFKAVCTQGTAKG
jgi:hypothetical protein